MPLENITSMPTTALGCLLAFMLWFLIWAPLVALLEYGAHRWIMHKANRWLDPKLQHLKAMEPIIRDRINMNWSTCL